MSAASSVPDARRPIGRFITEQVLPRWEELNSYPRAVRHNQTMDYGLRHRRILVHGFRRNTAAFLYNGAVVGGRQGRLTTLVSDQALEAASSKTLFQTYAAAAGLPVAGGQLFSAENSAQARKQVAAGGEWVLKPDTVRHGRGLSFRVTAETFDAAWQEALEVSARGSASTEGVVVEPFRDGLNLRFFVVGGSARAVALRVPLFVVGDGSRTVGELLAAALEHRGRNPLLRANLPPADALTPLPGAPETEEVLPAGELRLLQEEGRMGTGGLPYDITDEVCPELVTLAEQAAEAVPGLGAAGIDLVAADLNSAEGAVVLDADPRASVRIHRYPAFGQRRRAMADLTHLLRLRAEQWDRQIVPVLGAEDDDDG
ncbi:hypothetical protein [Nesterenkonia alkaliphila]|uniref:ATP-grasp domain-containing protein n=1 Tax=Nesterenkonia alkaliphila TaxID=1463631 RepID=A0A7K1UKQ1_9MICC|nr:hypothetical protein [Nesterenkonia alkaliphila]MVT27006.1 hypothetical protein [Nesterenkonia alkaliphila]